MQPKPVADKNHLIWIDLEMTGLNVDKHTIVEIATIVTDGQLNVGLYSFQESFLKKNLSHANMRVTND